MSDDMFLRDAVMKLARPHTTRVLQANDAGISCISEVEHEPLLTQLRAAVAGGTSPRAGVVAADGKIPLNPAASELFTTIAKQINAWYIALPNRREDRYIQDRLIDWYTDYENRRRAGQISDVVDHDVTRLLEKWEHQITSMFDPPSSFELTRPCPECGERWAFDPKNGDRIGALLVEYRTSGASIFDSATVHCRACDHLWKGSHGSREVSWAIDHETGVVA